jgi:hypothetical protein
VGEIAAAIIGALTGAIAGSVATLTWETHLKPQREREKVAKVLRVEVAANRQTLIGVSQMQSKMPDAIPLDFQLRTDSLDALTGPIGELPTDVVTRVLMFYSQVRYLIQAHDFYTKTLDQINASPSESREHAYYEERARNGCIAFYEAVQIAIDYAETAFRLLDAIPRERLGASYSGVLTYERERIDRLSRQQGYK